MTVRLIVLGDPKPLSRPRAFRNKKTGQMIWLTPGTTLQYQQLVRTAALQRKEEIEALRAPDPYGRMTVQVDMVFRNHRHADASIVVCNIMDGLGLALGVHKQSADKYFIGGSRKVDVIPGLTEGSVLIEITAYQDGKREELI